MKKMLIIGIMFLGLCIGYSGGMFLDYLNSQTVYQNKALCHYYASLPHTGDFKWKPYHYDWYQACMDNINYPVMKQ